MTTTDRATKTWTRGPSRLGDAVQRGLGRVSWPTWTVAVLAVTTFVSRVPGLLYNGMFDRDESYLAVMGDIVRGGGQLYVDVIDRKPPVVPVMYAALRELSVDMRVIRLFVAVLIFVNGLVVTEIVRRLTLARRAALFAGVLSIIGTALFLPPDAQAANFELWGMLPASLAILCVLRTRDSVDRKGLWFALAGAAVVVAANCKQPYIVVGLPVLLEAFRQSALRWRSMAAVAIGAFAVAVPIFAVFGRTEMLRWVWIDNGDYLDGGISLARAAAIGLGLSAVFLLLHLPLMYGAWASLRRRFRPDVVIVTWLVGSVLVIPIGLRFFGHYYQQVVPPLAVLTGCALLTAPKHVWRVLAWLSAGLLVAMVGLSLVHRPDLTNYTALGRYVQQITTPDERIVVWGALPDVYVAANRRPSGIFLHDGYLTGNWASRSRPLGERVIAQEPFRSRWELFFDDVNEHPPAVVINAARPDTDWALYGPESFPIGSWLNRCYDLDRVVDGLGVWRRDAGACPID